MSKLGRVGARLYRGDVSVDFVGRRLTWYAISGLILVVAIVALLVRGLNYGIEFKGGVEYNAQFASGTDLSSKVSPITNAVVDTNITNAANPVVVVSGQNAIRVDVKPLDLGQNKQVADAIKRASGSTEVNSTVIGPTWGEAIARKALTGLVVFVVLVVLFIWAYFREWRMSVAGMVALAHDLVITVGVYALTGFEVTPATVTGLLTILGYSLYDTVVVFDKVRENTRGIATSTRRTYADAANLAVNQTLVRSINTSLAALLPVGAILYIGTFQLGSGPLKDLALALFVGMAAGAYSSIFIATPLLAQLKMREPAMVTQAKKVASRRAQQEPKVPAEVMAPARRGASSRANARAASSGAASRKAGGAAAVAEAAPLAGATQYVASELDRETADEPTDVEIPGEASDVEVPDESPRVLPAAAATRRPPPNRATQPPSPRPMRGGAAAKRAQPQRQPRSKRGKH
ncbi:MAG: protein translocase subunit SecF [Nocardioidaceae bacterium]